MPHDMSRRTFLKLLGGGLAGAAAGGAFMKREDILLFSMPIRLPGKPGRTWGRWRRATISPGKKFVHPWLWLYAPADDLYGIGPGNR